MKVVGQRLPTDLWHSPVLVAVSGGSDSMALVRLVLQLREVEHSSNSAFRLFAFHFDHQWTPNSGTTAAWVKDQMLRLGVETIAISREELAAGNEVMVDPQSREAPGVTHAGPQSEAAARSCRYRALAEVARRLGVRYALTGHTADDQVETILMRIGRGTGLPGLCGIPDRRQLTDECVLLRPLLSVTRVELRQYLAELGQEYCEDPSNSDPKWTRNRVRNQVLPWLRTNFTPHVDDALLRLAELARDQQGVVEHLSQLYQAAVLEISPGILRIDTRVLACLNEGVVRTLLVYWWNQTELPHLEMSQARWRELTAVALRPKECETPSNKWPRSVDLPGQIRASRSKGVLRIETAVV